MAVPEPIAFHTLFEHPFREDGSSDIPIVARLLAKISPDLTLVISFCTRVRTTPLNP